MIGLFKLGAPCRSQSESENDVKVGGPHEDTLRHWSLSETHAHWRPLEAVER